MDFYKYARNKSNDKKILDDSREPNVAVLFAEGDISKDGEGIASDDLVKEIHDIRKDENIKALVLRINSPGGSALASDEICRELKLLAESKTLIVSMGDLAASGGYYIAAPAHRIFAQRSTITGSIGVFGVLPYTGQMFKEKIGIDFDFVQTNQYSTMSLNKKLSTNEFLMIQEEVDAIYKDFLEIVAKGRKMSVEQVKKIAKGRVWIGEDAIKVGLVDELGGLRDAMSYAAKKEKISDPIYSYYPKQEEDKFSELIMAFADEDAKTNMSKSSIGKEALKMIEIIKLSSNLSGVQARLPFILDIR